jgi:hypothetical protein
MVILPFSSLDFDSLDLDLGITFDFKGDSFAIDFNLLYLDDFLCLMSFSDLLASVTSLFSALLSLLAEGSLLLAPFSSLFLVFLLNLSSLLLSSFAVAFTFNKKKEIEERKRAKRERKKERKRERGERERKRRKRERERERDEKERGRERKREKERERERERDERERERERKREKE